MFLANGAKRTVTNETRAKISASARYTNFRRAQGRALLKPGERMCYHIGCDHVGPQSAFVSAEVPLEGDAVECRNVVACNKRILDGMKRDGLVQAA